MENEEWITLSYLELAQNVNNKALMELINAILEKTPLGVVENNTFIRRTKARGNVDRLFDKIQQQVDQFPTTSNDKKSKLQNQLHQKLKIINWRLRGTKEVGKFNDFNDDQLDRIHSIIQQLLNYELTDIVFCQTLSHIAQVLVLNNEAELFLKKALLIDPTDTGTLFIYGMFFQYLNRIDEAEKIYLDDIKYNPSTTRSWSSLGLIYQYHQSRFYKAEEIYRTGLIHQPSSLILWNNLGVLYQQQKQLNKAEEAFGKALGIDPTYFTGWTNIANTFSLKKKFDAAEQALKTAIELEPMNQSVWNHLGAVYHAQKKFNEAEEVLKKSLDIDPISLRAWSILASVYIKTGEIEKAEDANNSILKLDPNNKRAKQNMKFLAVQQNKQQIKKTFRLSLKNTLIPIITMLALIISVLLFVVNSNEFKGYIVLLSAFDMIMAYYHIHKRSKNFKTSRKNPNQTIEIDLFGFGIFILVIFVNIFLFNGLL